MRRLLMMAALAVAAIAFGGTGIASAGNCGYAYSTVGDAQLVPGYIGFKGVVGNCTGVSQIEFGSTQPFTNPDGSGWIYDSFYPTAVTTFPYGATLKQWSAGDVEKLVIYYHACWWSGGGLHWMANTNKYRIQSIDIHGVRTWGPWHTDTPSPAYSFICG